MHADAAPPLTGPMFDRLAAALRPLAGRHIALIAPAGGVRDERIDTALRVLDAAGIRAHLGAHTRDHHRYLAGTAAARLSDLQAAFAHPDIAAVWSLRGGYGSAQFADTIDWSHIPADIPLVGYSDASVLMEAFRRHGRLAIHGPVATELALPGATESEQAERLQSMRALAACLTGAASAWPLDLHDGPDGPVAGRLVGGNLTTLASVAGTPAALTVDEDVILLLEDVGEAEFRLERCLQQLLDSIDSRHVRAICLGRFEHCTLANGMASLAAICAEYTRARGIPLYHGAPIGHGPVNHAWHVGAPATIANHCLTVPATAA